MNRRILVIDDQQAIHDDFRLILGAEHADAELALHTVLSEFGISEPRRPAEAAYELEFASQGQEGFEAAKTARELGRPFAAAFLDVRMPPGWDGVETMARIAEVDREIQFVAMTAYSDSDRSDLADAAIDASRLLLIRKPFAAEEIEQLALALTQRWNLRRAEAERIQVLQRALELLREAGECTGADRAEFILAALVSLSHARSGAILRSDGVRAHTETYDPAQMPDVAPPATPDFSPVQRGYSLKLNDANVLVLEDPELIERMPDLMHLVVTSFASALPPAQP